MSQRILTAPGIDADAANAAFEDDIDALLARADARTSEILSFGVETEYPLINEQYRPLAGVRRDALVDQLYFAAKEFGAATIEVRTEPHTDLADMAAELGTREAVLTDQAAAYGAVPLRYGTHPFMDVEDFERSYGERYETFSNLLTDNANPAVPPRFGAGETDPRSVGVSGMICSTQLNIQAPDAAIAVDLTNGLYAANPYLIALTGNARIFEGEDTGYADVRMPLWERSCDVRTVTEVRSGAAVKPGKIDRYYRDLADYLHRLDRFFFADPTEIPAIGQVIGHQWKDVRIKPLDEVFLVENRPISTQPTAAQDIAAHAYTLGQAAYRMEHPDEPLPDIEQVNRNRYAAMFNGMDTPLYDLYGRQMAAADAIAPELARAAAGLSLIGEPTTYLQPLYDALATGHPPSETSARAYAELRDHEPAAVALADSLAYSGT